MDHCAGKTKAVASLITIEHWKRKFTKSIDVLLINGHSSDELIKLINESESKIKLNKIQI